VTERPRGAKEFQRLLQRHAAEIGQLPQRVMHLVRVGVVCAMLDDVRHDDGAHLFIVKGGTAMQMRFGIEARATTDLDVVFRGRLEQWLDLFDQALVNRIWNGFAVTRKTNPVQIEVTGLGYRPWRVPLQIRYEGRDFGSLTFEVAIDDISGAHHDLVEPDGVELAVFAIHPPSVVPCLDVAYQIAQKLHACTEPLDGGNDRVRDVVDIWLLETLADPDDLTAVRAAAVETFHRRKRHIWPPVVEPSPSWSDDYAQLLADHPDAPPTIEDAVAFLAELIARIDAAGPFDPTTRDATSGG
jgi:hypothetical protein